MDEYEKQAQKFLKDTQTTFKVKFVEHGKHFEDDNDERDIYLITLQRGERTFEFKFGQSINCSRKYKKVESDGKDYKRKPQRIYNIKNKDFKEPTAYDVLSCLTKYDPDTFEEFCSSYGYEEDSRRAEKTYFKVRDEFKEVRMLWSDEQIEELQKIE